MISFAYRNTMPLNEKNDAHMPETHNAIHVSAHSHESLIENFNREEERLQQQLAQLNSEFEEKLAALATQQLLTRMGATPQ